ncbi:Esterase [Hypsizygus marmoreus]|uniref:Esterase n=1 Tax=Hypsizygus marmoreus TaxID=39966 RepID=A0A369K5H9_HYPMA|nr:Esterase [Hypsizygus marmoreus]
MAYTFRYQPLKGMYLTYQAMSTLLLRVPLWVLLAIWKRPKKSWSLKRSVLVKLLGHSMQMATSIGPISQHPDHLAITGGVDVNGIWVEPAPQLVTGRLKSWMFATSVEAIRIPGYWMHEQGSTIEVGAPPAPGEKVLYHLHGGAYVRLSAHPTDLTAAIPRGIVKHVDSIHRSFSIEYRLSSASPFKVANPFPAALLDALAGYNYLVNVVGFSPTDIVIVGDSAGANLAHALTRYLVEYKDTPELRMPAPPGSLILLSPWADMSTSHDIPGGSMFESIPSDYLHPSRNEIDYARVAFTGPLGGGILVHNPYISPASLNAAMIVDFKGFPRTCIVAGGAEILYDQIITLRDRMAKDLGKDLYYYEAKDAVHDFLVLEWHEPERTETLEAIANWLAVI